MLIEHVEPDVGRSLAGLGVAVLVVRLKGRAARSEKRER